MTELPTLAASDFAAFFEAIHGRPPFPWQLRLVRQIAAAGWPSVLDLPTGTGKTAAIDAAVFHLALDAGSAERRAPLRIVYVVDRRTIVDQAFDRARVIADAIAGAAGGVLATVRQRLAWYGRESAPLLTALMRGAIARNDAWARSPDQPLVAVSTVDQVGSRLLFRGYGVSDSMKPVHAGLLGNDALYLLDEVHLSQPFQQTLAAVKDRYGAWRDAALPRRFEVVEMSATPGLPRDEAFRLEADDRDHPLLARRLAAQKPVSLRSCGARQFAAEIERAVKTLLVEAGQTVAVVVNRVAAAREIHERLTGALDADVHLVTGRMRPLDREQAERALLPRVRAGRLREVLSRPLVVVATQCIEAGADFDFDGLVSECASLDALRQRFGRLDRLGEHGSARGVIVAKTDTLKDDAVYGAALGATWDWLVAQGGAAGRVDFGLSGLVVPDDALERGLLAPKEDVPVMLPAHLDAWVQTSPLPTPDPEVALWLHGPARGVADVQVVWRADLTEALLRRAAEGDADAAALALGAVEALPPASGEAMSIPFSAVRRWLDGLAEPELADVEGARELGDERRGEGRTREPRYAVAWRGEQTGIIGASRRDTDPDDEASGTQAEGSSLGRLVPGDTIIVPLDYGGIAAGSWAPAATVAPTDLAEVATLRQRGRATLRLHPAIVGSFGLALPDAPSPSALDAEDLDDAAAVRDWLRVAADALRPLAPEALDLRQTALSTLVLFLERQSSRRRGVVIERVAYERAADERAAEGESAEPARAEHFVVTARARVPHEGDRSGDVTTEDDSASFTGVEVTLAKHMEGVGSIAADFATRVGLPESVVADLRLAGRWHDLGKTDPRFQRLLHGGSEFKALVAPEPIAKSRTPLTSRQARLRAAQLSGYPRGARHEVMSVALMCAAEAALKAQAHDWDLVLHLTASHHGRCRPLAPWVADPEPVNINWSFDGVAIEGSSHHGLERLDSGVGDRFWALVRRYGWWSLAWLEAILRLADHRRSEAEQRNDVDEMEGAAP